MAFLAKFIDPAGAVSYSCYATPGKTPDPAKATPYTNERAAHTAGSATIYGSRDAFWNSERESARMTAASHRGWTYEVEEIAD
jgi:hypothetical protein